MASAAEAAVFRVVALLFLLCGGATAATWCVTRSDASDRALQAALDYACGSGADCGPIQPSGLCFLPNTVQAHASYAFNSYYQRRGSAPDSCSFGGTSTIARTDPSLSFYTPSLSHTGTHTWVFLFFFWGAYFGLCFCVSACLGNEKSWDLFWDLFG